jgi:hypothetical protein
MSRELKQATTESKAAPGKLEMLMILRVVAVDVQSSSTPLLVMVERRERLDEGSPSKAAGFLFVTSLSAADDMVIYCHEKND